MTRELENKTLDSFAKVATIQRNSRELTPDFWREVGGTMHGQLHETGVVAVKNRRVAAAVRGPNYIPTSEGFGGKQREVFVEESLAVSGREPGLSQQILDSLAQGISLEQVSQKFNGPLIVGVETECVKYFQNRRIRVDSSHESVELTKGQHEVAHAPVSGPQDYLKMKSGYVLKDLSTALHTETSAPLVGRASEQVLNDGGELGPYIQIVQTFLLEKLSREHDPEAWVMWDQIAHSEGLPNMEVVLNRSGSLAPWFMNALHMSIGLPHFKENGQNRIRTEQLVGMGDLMCSELGAVAGLITASTPVIYGVEPKVGGVNIRDARLAGRHLLTTSGPNSQPLLTPDNFIVRTTENIVSQRSHTIARAGYTSGSNGSIVAAMHSQARIRSEVGYGKSANATSGRVEATGLGATPSLLDQAGALGYLQLLAVLALEADASNIPTVEHAKDLGLTAGADFDVRTLNRAFNVSDDNHPKVVRALIQAEALVNYMRQKYPSLEESCHYAGLALIRIRSTPSGSLGDYLQRPSGSFADVMRNEYNRCGKDPEALVVNVHNFQQQQARLIQNCI